MKLYIAGPMTGKPDWNFPAFNAMAKLLRHDGIEAINPAENFDGRTDLPWETYLRKAVSQVTECDGIVMLRGWENSRGAMLELHVARALGLKVYDDNLAELEIGSHPPENILDEAKRLVTGDRQNQYGPPDQDFKRTAAMWSALKGVDFEPREVAMFMICLKLSRETHQRKRDSAVDIAGYAHCMHICQ